MSAPVPVLYIGGKGRSGSTIVNLTLSTLPGYFAVGELRRIWEYRSGSDRLCGCGTPLAACGFWEAVGERAFGGWDEVDLERMHALDRSVNRTRHVPWMLAPTLRPDFRRRFRELREALSRLYAAVAEVAGARVVVDSSKAPGCALLLERTPGIELSVLHLVRDSRGVAYSRTRRVRRPEITDRVEYMARWHPARTSAKWIVDNGCFDLFAALGMRRVTLRYESFARDPRAFVERALDALDLPFADRDLDDLEGGTLTLRAEHTVSGNPLRFGRGTVTLRADERWQHGLPAGQQRLVAALTAPWLARYGYLDADEPAHAGTSSR